MARPTDHPEDQHARRLFLASRSPRRADLLREHGFEFEVVAPSVDDALLTRGAVTPSQWVAALAYIKAAAGLERLCSESRGRGAVVLGADTVVVKDDRVIGQPRDEHDARRIVTLLRNGSHEVVTGVALVGEDMERDIFVDRSSVVVGAVSDEQIDAYIVSGQWRGKAGAYNLVERQRDGWPIECRGEPASVMGLPMRLVVPRLRRLFGVPAPEPAA